ncbi:N1221-domain-containing protein [Epithele typhae]|uniref:N1221-domain-containing protein n=1 Tax=Epithele typhae TaxID=378194 RepID=UPI0020084C64|nr:N1221-domain-containing protein [Epithele typhae]KAH9918243.1 N1221-domain-containing protein [Epithele typhae]
MVPLQLSSHRIPADALSPQQVGLDSITLGQLKAMVGSAPKPKQSFYDFRYYDEDTVMNEIEEFYSYAELPQVAENLRAWDGSYPGEWTTSPIAQRKAHVEVLLESLEHRDAEIRFTNARRLFYILQGQSHCALHLRGDDLARDQLHWIIENCKIVKDANGLSNIIEAIKIASSKHDLLCSLSDADAAHFNISSQEKADFMEEVTTELSVYLGMLYHMVEVFKTQDDFADELMSLEPPLPVYLFNIVSGLRDKSAKGYPVKKLLLILWKTLLTCCGGLRELANVKRLTRELAGLSPVADEAAPIKASPIDLEMFRQEISMKYPTFNPNAVKVPAAVPVDTSKLSHAYAPIPVRHHYEHDGGDSQHQDQTHSGMQHYGGSQPGSSFRAMPQPATPAPSPPPSPKPKKQQFQTDQSRPFLFPFSRSRIGYNDSRLVPFAIDEADKLYSKHMYVSLSLWQMWRTREECMTVESGLEYLPGAGRPSEPKIPAISPSQDEDAAEKLPDVALLDIKIVEAEKMIAEGETGADKRRAMERREALVRLKRVEQIYVSFASNLGSATTPIPPPGSRPPRSSGWVLVLLKLLLATVSTANNGAPPPAAAGFPPGVVSLLIRRAALEQMPPKPATLDETDVTRHREVTSKALLLDTNCLLLILKIFGLQEVSTAIVSKADSPEHNFFRYCQTRFARRTESGVGIDDHMQRASRQTIVRTTTLPNGQKHDEEVDMLTDFSWRNFFSTINFAKIMQKLSKHRSHRIRMLVQYKSSAVLKRILKVQHPLLQLHVLKLIKSQVPFCGRKWRQSNMQVITAIYLNCRPDLRDEWLTGIEVDDVYDAQAQEQALRHLVKFYNNKRYGVQATVQTGGAHRRAASMSHHLEGLHPGPELSGMLRPVQTPNTVDADVFPPLRANTAEPSIFLPYVTEDIAFEEEYEEYLRWSEETAGDGAGASAWARLPDLVHDIADNISDSESIASIGELNEEARLLESGGEKRDGPDENVNNWEHMSPKTMAALAKSPSAHGRRSSSGSGGLRPVMPFELESGPAIEDDDDDEEELGPMPREPGAFQSGGGVDEVEYAYGVKRRNLLTSYGLSSGRANAYPQSIDSRGHDVCTNAARCGPKSASFAGASSERRMGT